MATKRDSLRLSYENKKRKKKAITESEINEETTSEYARVDSLYGK
jgi:hypothetical protein